MLGINKLVYFGMVDFLSLLLISQDSMEHKPRPMLF